MASGGHHPKNPKSSASEPKQRRSWQRTTSMSDKDDNNSLNNFPNDLRPNNWDFSDWRPSGSQDQTKRRKKGNPEWEREQSLTQESPPPSERQHTTPRTFPMTKMAPSTPTSQRLALENLRQHLTFSDQDLEDGVSNDGEREPNHDRNILRRRENLAGSHNRLDMGVGHGEPQLSRPVPNRREDRNNRNNNKQNQNEVRAAHVKPDSSQIVGRLMQIRDYIKQANSMMESLSKSGDSPGYREEMLRLKTLMDHLREQERGYTGLLQNLLSMREESDVNDASREMTPNLDAMMDDTTSLDIDVQSEVSDREVYNERRSLTSALRPRIEDKLGLTSDNEDEDEEVEVEAPSESSDNSGTMDDTVIARHDRLNQAWDFELSENELAISGGQQNPREAAETLVALRQQQELLQKLVEQQEQMRALRGRQAALLALQQDAEAKLATTRQKSNDARQFSNDLEDLATGMTNRAESLAANESNAGRPADPDLLDIRQQLQYLRNELKTQDPNLQPPPQAVQRNQQRNQNFAANQDPSRPKNMPPRRPPSPQMDRSARHMSGQSASSQNNPAAAQGASAMTANMIPPTEMSKEQLQDRLQELLSKKNRLDQLISEEFSQPIIPSRTEDMDRDDLKNKLMELHSKKTRMDDMLKELQSLRATSQSTFLLNNAVPAIGNVGTNTANITVPEEELDPIEAATGGSEQLANDALGMIDARQKLKKLTEVKGRLSQLKSLVEYYQDSNPDAQAMDNDEDVSSTVPQYSDYGAETEVTRDKGPERDARALHKVTKPQVNIPVRPAAQEDSDENNSSSESGSESESGLSSLGTWGDDPEIREKVRKLHEAREKLKQIESLVAIVQESPDVADGLPSNLIEIAASMEDVESQMEQQEERDRSVNAASGRPEDVPQMSERDVYYQSKMKDQMQELDQLKDEKTRLLTIQSQLQTLHDRFQQAEEQRDKEDEESVRETRRKSGSGSQTSSQQQESGSQQNTGGPSVTFSSNEEVYYKMRNQRMLREELREKKKQLESIMKKDRNKKQYYKNQDNQSDTVSYSTEMFGASASVDQTMATWGGSTVDNLESITEDGAAQDNDDDDDEEDEDDGYPIDGVLQVEEEEEENQSDNETYTIEQDVRQRRKARSMATGPSQARAQGSSPRKGPKRSFPRAQGRQEGARPKEAWAPTRQSDFNKWSRNGRKSRQENYRSAEEIVHDNEEDPRSKSATEELQRKLEETSKLCQSLLCEQQQPMAQLTRQASSVSGFGNPNQLTSDLQQQLQQQQLMMSLNQCYQQMSMQQMEMQNMQRQLQSLALQQTDTSDINESGFSADLRTRSMQSLFSPMLPRQSPNLMFSNSNDPFPFSSGSYQHLSPAAGSNRLLRRAVDGDQGQQRTTELSEPPERHRRSSRQSRSDSYRSKKKSQSPPQLNVPQARGKAPVSQLYTGEAEEEEEETRPKFTPDRQKFEEYLAKKKQEFLERNKLQDRSPQVSQDTGQRGGRTSLGAEGGVVYRPGLSSGISGAGYADDGRSIASSIQSSVAAVTQANLVDPRAESARDSDDPNEMSLFETLRETIYSEVATLISQNENRPHYLIELFRELQLLSTDYLRQRVLYDVKDVVSKYLVEENAVTATPPRWMNTTNAAHFTTSELTPSESLVTSDDEEVKYLLQTKLKQRVAANLVAKERLKILERCGSMKDDKYDYQEQADLASSVSTPSQSFVDSPFNQDSLGETVINLDKTLKKMREYEEKLAAKSERVKSLSDQRGTDTGEVSSSAMDQGDDSSVNSDSVPYPRIDTQQLDSQIKAIMTEVIPVIKEHMDNMCSPQLLAYIKRLVLSLTRQYDGGQEFARFFHRQLGSILQDSLAKYEGRKMRECGEDLLVDMSEVLFNELAFFRLMQDLDDPLIAEKVKKAQPTSSDDEDGFEKADDGSDDETDTTESSTANASDNRDDTRPSNTEEEELGKSRDDDFANSIEIQDAEDKDDDPESPFKAVQIELAPSETKPYTRIGSDEDDESADDESQSNEDPSETAVSIDARRIHDDGDDTLHDNEAMGDGNIVASAPLVMLAETEKSSPSPGGAVAAGDQGRDADQGAGSAKALSKSPELVNGDILNGDMEVITMDDLPSSLTVMTSDELQNAVNQEQAGNVASTAILSMMDGQEEMAGDPQFLKQPDETSC